MKTILFKAECGLANRLRALVGYRALASGSGAQLCVEWVSNGSCNARFRDLFEATGWEEVRFTSRSEFESLRRSDGAVEIVGEPWFTRIWHERGREFDSEADFNRKALAHLRALRPIPELSARIDAYLDAHDLAACTAIHIRSTDNVHDYAAMERADPDFEREKVSQLDGFMALIDARIAAGQGVFLCTDNPSIEAEIHARHAVVLSVAKEFESQRYERHVKRNYAIFGRVRRLADRTRYALGGRDPNVSWRTTSVADALVDLLLLSRCREIVGTYYSSVSEIAALIGDVPLAIMQGSRCVPHEFTERIRSNVSG
jgi:hypothetical protein